MANIINLTCPSCGGKLQITNDIDRFSCGYCGNEQIVNRSGGIVTLEPVVERLSKIEAGVDKTAAELAITRLKNEISELTAEFEKVNKHPYIKHGISINIFLIFASLLIFVLLIDWLGYRNWSAILQIFFLFIYFVVAIFLSFMIVKIIKQPINRKIEPIKKDLENKKKELKKYQDIVGGDKIEKR